jgi:hypothetical protein
MAITGSTALATVAAPASSSPRPYVVYTVTNPTGIQLAGFTLQNTANIPVTLTIYQDSYNNPIYSGTLAANAGPTQVLLNGFLSNGETILALANQGGVVNIEVDGILNVTDVVSQMLLGVMFMLNQLGAEMPNQSMLNAGSFSF